MPPQHRTNKNAKTHTKKHPTKCAYQSTYMRMHTHTPQVSMSLVRLRTPPVWLLLEAAPHWEALDLSALPAPQLDRMAYALARMYRCGLLCCW